MVLSDRPEDKGRVGHAAFVPSNAVWYSARPEVRPHRLARPRTLDFHSSNTGSNPVGVTTFTRPRRKTGESTALRTRPPVAPTRSCRASEMTAAEVRVTNRRPSHVPKAERGGIPRGGSTRGRHSPCASRPRWLSPSASLQASSTRWVATSRAPLSRSDSASSSAPSGPWASHGTRPPSASPAVARAVARIARIDPPSTLTAPKTLSGRRSEGPKRANEGAHDHPEPGTRKRTLAAGDFLVARLAEVAARPGHDWILREPCALRGPGFKWRSSRSERLLESAL